MRNNNRRPYKFKRSKVPQEKFNIFWHPLDEIVNPICISGVRAFQHVGLGYEATTDVIPYFVYFVARARRHEWADVLAHVSNTRTQIYYDIVTRKIKVMH